MVFIEGVIFLLMLTFSCATNTNPNLMLLHPQYKYEGSEKIENKFSSLNQAKPCNMAPQKIELSERLKTNYVCGTLSN